MTGRLVSVRFTVVTLLSSRAAKQPPSSGWFLRLGTDFRGRVPYSVPPLGVALNTRSADGRFAAARVFGRSGTRCPAAEYILRFVSAWSPTTAQLVAERHGPSLPYRTVAFLDWALISAMRSCFMSLAPRSSLGAIYIFL
jgi:hypothetical protein